MISEDLSLLSFRVAIGALRVCRGQAPGLPSSVPDRGSIGSGVKAGRRPSRSDAKAALSLEGRPRNLRGAPIAPAEIATPTHSHTTSAETRRLFITDAILGGLPPHIAQIIAGHRDINVTLGYKAVYPDEAVQAHLAFLARRRGLRPTDEYRVPTDEE